MSSSTPPLSPPSPPLPPPARSRSSQQIIIPHALLKPGIEMLKVSVKSARRVKSRRLWIEVELGTGGNVGSHGSQKDNGLKTVKGEAQNLRICWEKSGRGGGAKREASIPLSSLRDLRFGTSGSPYRTSLHLSPLIEPRWITLIYLLPSSNLLSPTIPTYKLVHFIAPTAEIVQIWKTFLEKAREGRGLGTGGSGSGVYLGICGTNGQSGSEVSEGEEERTVKEEEVCRLCARLGMGMSRDAIGTAFRKIAAPHDFLDFSAFQNFVKVLKKRREVEEIFQSLASSDLGMSDANWKQFICETQGYSSQIAEELFIKYSLGTPYISLDAFSSFLVSSDNPGIEDDSKQDMSRPLTEYYISSSHNTYLVGNQLQGESTIEGYIRALQQGCRCVELDVWDGDDGSPVITHGRTFTTKISALSTLQAIAQYAFLASPFPLILSLEIRCDVNQQEKLVGILKECLGERLVTGRIDGSKGELGSLPSPEQLKGRVLVKAKNLDPNKNSGVGLSVGLVDPETSSAESSQSSDSEFKRVFKAVRRSFDTGRSSNSSDSSTPTANQSSLPPPPTRLTSSYTPVVVISDVPVRSLPKPPLSASISSLLVYTTGVKARGFNKKETYFPTDVLSFGENKLLKMIRDEGVRNDLIGHNRNHLTRSYPKGIRVTSTNYEPHHLWNAGVQMVAVNWQTYDIGMELNTAMFARAGRSGYVLKPELLRKKGLEKDKESLNRVSQYILELEIISAQQLPRSRDPSVSHDAETTQLDPFVEATLFVPGLSTSIKRRTKVISGNAYNPIFRSVFTLPFQSNPSPGMLDLVFLRLEVLNARGNLKSAAEEGKGEFVGAYTTGIGGLLSGYRHLPLYDAVGDQHLFSSLFIRSKIVCK